MEVRGTLGPARGVGLGEGSRSKGRISGHTGDTGEGPGSCFACGSQGDLELVSLQTTMPSALSALKSGDVSAKEVSTPPPHHFHIPMAYTVCEN